MAKKYLTCAETAKLVRGALKEAFPGQKFSVKSSTYSGGASISVGWIDGPNDAQVSAVVNVFKGSYFDGSIDYKGSVYHMIDGVQVSMGADFIFTNREHSDAAVLAAIGRVSRRYAGNFKQAGIEAPSVEDFRKGRLWNVPFLSGGMSDQGNLQAEISGALYRHTFRARVGASKTAGRVMVIGDDGYSRQCGSGFTAAQLGE